MSSVSRCVAMPALLTSTSRRPKVFCTLANNATISSSRVRSAGNASASPPFCLMPAATSSSSAARRATSTVLAPSAANVSAIPRPIPWLAPVTIAILPCSCLAMFFSRRGPTPARSPRYDERIERGRALALAVHHQRIDLDLGDLRHGEDQPAERGGDRGDRGDVGGRGAAHAGQKF